jgi:hypothetical protein
VTKYRRRHFVTCRKSLGRLNANFEIQALCFQRNLRPSKPLREFGTPRALIKGKALDEPTSASHYG